MKKILLALILASLMPMAFGELVQNHDFTGVDETPWSHSGYAGWGGSWVDLDDDYFRGCGWGDLATEWTNNAVWQDTGEVFLSNAIYLMEVEWGDGQASATLTDVQIALFDATTGLDIATTSTGPPAAGLTWYTNTVIVDTSMHPEVVGNNIGVGARNMSTVGSWFDVNYISVTVDPQAFGPIPANDSDTSDNVGEAGIINGSNKVDLQVQWSTALDGGATYPGITGHYVYVKEKSLTDPNEANGTPNWDLWLTGGNTPVLETGNTHDLTLAAGRDLNPGSIYFWKVEEQISSAPAGDPTNLMGQNWTFETSSSKPAVITEPDPALVPVGGTATFEVEATSAYPITNYQWYISADDVIGDDGTPFDSGAAASTTTYSPAIGEAASYVYCTVTNSNGGTTDTAMALLEVERLMAYWTFDASDMTDSSANAWVCSMVDPNTVAGNTITPDDDYNVGVGGTTAMEFFGYGADGATEDEGELMAAAGTEDNANNYYLGLTVSAWINTSITNSWQIMAGKQDRSGEDSEGWSFNVNPSESIHLGAPSLDLYATSVVTDGQWHFAAATFDGSVAKLYIDGILEAESDPTVVGTEANTSNPIEIGGESSSNVAPYEGLLDDVKIYNYARHATQIMDDYNVFAATKLNKCVADYAVGVDVSGPAGEPDCLVDIYDFAEMAAGWLTSGCHGDPGTYPCDMD